MKDFNDVVLEAQKGNQRVMDIVIKHMYKCLYSKVTKMWKELPGGHTAEDMVQYAMLGVMKAIKTYDGNGYAKNWIWLHVRSAIDNEARYLYYDKRKANMVSYFMDKPLKANEDTTLAHIIPCEANTEQDALDNVVTNNFLQGLRKELSKIEFIVMNYMVLEYTTKDIIRSTGYKPKAIDNAKERIKRKVRKYLVAV